MFEVVVWLFFGMLAGWIASLAFEKNTHLGAGLSISVGIIGAIIGGVLVLKTTGDSGDNLHEGGLMGAMVGSIALLIIVKVLKH